MSYLPQGATPAWMQTLPRTLDPTLHNLELAMRANGSSEQDIMQMKMYYILQNQHKWTAPLKSNTTIKYLAFNTNSSAEAIRNRNLGVTDNNNFYNAQWTFHQPLRILRFAILNLRAVVQMPFAIPNLGLSNPNDSTGRTIVQFLATIDYSTDGGVTWGPFGFNFVPDATGKSDWYTLPGFINQFNSGFLSTQAPTITLNFDGTNLIFINTSSTATLMMSFNRPDASPFRRIFQRNLISLTSLGNSTYPCGPLWPLCYYLTQKSSFGGLDVIPGNVEAGASTASVLCMIPPQIGYAGSVASHDPTYKTTTGPFGPLVLSYDSTITNWTECSDRPMNNLSVGILDDYFDPMFPSAMSINIAVEVLKE